jgi:hypothetical protein
VGYLDIFLLRAQALPPKKEQAQAAAASFSAPTAARHVRARVQTCKQRDRDGCNGATEPPTPKPKPKRARPVPRSVPQSHPHSAPGTGLRATGQLKRARPAPALEQFPAFCRHFPLAWLVGQPLSRVQRRAYKNPPLLDNPSSLLHFHLSSCPHSSQSSPLTHTCLVLLPASHSVTSSLIARHSSSFTSIYPIYRIHHPCPLRRRRLPALPSLS